MIRSLTCCLFAVCLLVAGCKKAGENKDAVREAVIQHLTKNAALDVNALDIAVTDVKFQGDEANAQVSIKPKAAPDQGMTMSYTLNRKGDKWEVKGKAAGHGGAGGPMGGGMGAPPAAGAESSPHGGGAAAGTPEPKGALGDAPKAPAAGGGDLPPGHPPVNASGAKK